MLRGQYTSGSELVDTRTMLVHVIVEGTVFKSSVQDEALVNIVYFVPA